MAQFVNDTFTDADATAITSHTGETGATWTKHGFATNTTAPTVRSNRLRCDDTGAVNAIYYTSGTPAAANYTVSLDWITGSGGAQTGDIVGPLGRMATGTTDFYGALYLQTAGGIRLYKFVAGTGTVIVAAVTFTPASSATYRITLDMQGTTIAGRIQRASDNNWLNSSGSWVSGQANFGSVTDSSVSAAGRAGFWGHGENANDGAKFTFDNFSADDVVSGTTAPISVLVPKQVLALSSSSFRGV